MDKTDPARLQKKAAFARRRAAQVVGAAEGKKSNESLAGLPLLPYGFGDIETRSVLKRLPNVRSSLAELKGLCSSIPNQAILLSSLWMQEAKDSLEIENIHTTHDELYRSVAGEEHFDNDTKEVRKYIDALGKGFQYVKDKNNPLLPNKAILSIQQCIIGHDAGFRKIPGTTIKNSSGVDIYTPPQRPDDVEKLMDNLEKFINQPGLCDWDPLVKLAVIHCQFERIHPFYDGNGRTGRVINALYLVKEGLLDSPVLYLSRYINENKAEYYRLLGNIEGESGWEKWILWVLQGVEETALQATSLVREIKELMGNVKKKLRSKAAKNYSKGLVDSLFKRPYTTVNLLAQDLSVSPPTAGKYLKMMTELKIVKTHKKGSGNGFYYLNIGLCNLLLGVGKRMRG